MKLRPVVLLLGAVMADGVTTAALADYDAKIVGSWLLSAKSDRFGDGGAYTAMTVDALTAFGVRCLQKDLSLAMVMLGDDPHPIAVGDVFEFKLKTDDKPIVVTYGKAINSRTIQIETKSEVVRAIRDGRETAVRREDKNGTVATRVFKTAGAKKAFADLSKECPLD